MTQEATRQADNVLPPRTGAVLCITLDATSRRYDLSLADIGAAFGKGGELYISMYAETASAYFFFAPTNAGTVDETAALAAGSAVSGFTSNGAFIIPAGSERNVRINRTTDRYLVVKGSGAGTLRIYASSQMTAGAVTTS